MGTIFFFLLCQSIFFLVTSQCPVLDIEICACVENDITLGNYIDCRNRNLQSIPPFEPTNSTWDTLLLTNNLLSEVPDGAFENLAVRYINLGSNYINKLGESVFSELQDSIQQIDLRDNRLIAEEVLYIQNLPVLETLFLGYNLITSLDNGQFVGLTSLSLLDLEYNELVLLGSSYTENVPTITTLNLYGNSLLYIEPDAMDHLTTLQLLEFGANDLERIPTEALQGLTDIRDISLWSNAISEVGEDDLAALSPTLTQLTLGGNPITELPETVFRDVPNLTRLNLAIMTLTDLPDRIFENMTSLFDVAIYQNSFTELPNAFQNLPSLEYFSATDNFILSIRGDEFEGSTSLRSIQLDNNAIVTVNQSLFCANPSINALYLTANNIEDFDACAALSLDFLQITLVGNPINCGCDILWLKNAGILSSQSATYCASPPDLAGRPVSDITGEEFQCDLDPEEECANVCQ